MTVQVSEDEEAVAWLTCIETIFSRFKQVRLMGNDRALVGFDLNRHAVMAVCREGWRKVRVSLDSIKFPELTPVEQTGCKPGSDSLGKLNDQTRRSG